MGGEWRTLRGERWSVGNRSDEENVGTSLTMLSSPSDPKSGRKEASRPSPPSAARTAHSSSMPPLRVSTSEEG